LNEVQLKAVLQTEGPLLLLASPGSGKPTPIIMQMAISSKRRGIRHGLRQFHSAVLHPLEVRKTLGISEVDNKEALITAMSNSIMIYYTK
jgi:hypothetical protein